MNWISVSDRVLQKGSFLEEHVHLPYYILDQSPVTDAMKFLKAFKEDSHSPLYLPFVISVYALEEYRGRIGLVDGRAMRWLSRDESADHADETPKKHEVDRELMVQFTQQNIPNELETEKMELNTIESLWRHLVVMAKELPDTAKSDNVCRSNKAYWVHSINSDRN